MQIRMDKENRELKAHGSYEFPVNISYEQLSRYERGSFSWHWHPEIELTFVLSGPRSPRAFSMVFQTV